jgi:hypothetical protein
MRFVVAGESTNKLCSAKVPLLSSTEPIQESRDEALTAADREPPLLREDGDLLFESSVRR